MKKSLIFVLLVLFLMSLNILFLPFESEAGNIERVSVDNSGVQGDNDSNEPSISSDGRYVAFESDAENLVTGDSNAYSDVFVYDRDSDTIERVSVDNSGVQGNSGSRSPSISSDGRYVAFSSWATNLVTGDTNNNNDVFVYDRDFDTIERVSVDNSGVQGNSGSRNPNISSDGRYVAFESDSTNLVTGDTNGSTDVFVYDKDSDTIERVSVDNNGVQGDNESYYSSISSDGRYVAFSSDAENLVTGDTNADNDVFVYDRDTDTIEMVSVDNSGVQGESHSYRPSISSDGRYVAFDSYAENLVTGDTNLAIDVFVYDRDTDTIERVSVDKSGVQGDNDSYNPSISSDGRYVAFNSWATTLVTGDSNAYIDVFVYDRNTDTIERLSVADSGVQGDDNSYNPSISSDGRYVAFESDTTNLVEGDTNVSSDVFVSKVQNDELALDLGASGLWDYDGTTWTPLSGSSPTGICGWSEGLAMDFSNLGLGLWNHDGTAWTPISGTSPEAITDWSGGLAMDFGALGLWSTDGSVWTAISGSNVEDMEGWSGGLAMDFGAPGLWNYDGATWAPISGTSPEGICSWSGGLAMDFGGLGLWNYDGTTWTPISGSDVGDMAGWPNGLAMDFGASGLWNYDGSSWTAISGTSPEGICGWASGLAMDFGASGLYSYDGSTWTLITSSDVEDMDDVNLF